MGSKQACLCSFQALVEIAGMPDCVVWTGQYAGNHANPRKAKLLILRYWYYYLRDLTIVDIHTRAFFRMTSWKMIVSTHPPRHPNGFFGMIFFLLNDIGMTPAHQSNLPKGSQRRMISFLHAQLYFIVLAVPCIAFTILAHPKDWRLLILMYFIYMYISL